MVRFLWNPISFYSLTESKVQRRLVWSCLFVFQKSVEMAGNSFENSPNVIRFPGHWKELIFLYLSFPYFKFQSFRKIMLYKMQYLKLHFSYRPLILKCRNCWFVLNIAYLHLLLLILLFLKDQKVYLGLQSMHESKVINYFHLTL